jgi:hypothetical protein
MNNSPFVKINKELASKAWEKKSTYMMLYPATTTITTSTTTATTTTTTTTIKGGGFTSQAPRHRQFLSNEKLAWVRNWQWGVELSFRTEETLSGKGSGSERSEESWGESLERELDSISGREDGE